MVCQRTFMPFFIPVYHYCEPMRQDAAPDGSGRDVESHLQQALEEATDPDAKYHIRTALQKLVADES